jgi:hypothetical protein
LRIIGIAAVKNEIDVIEAFVRHNLAHVERLVVLDNSSTDGTLEVLRELSAEGLPLDLLEDRRTGKYQSLWMTRLMREEAVGRLQADWVLPLDADEFVAADGWTLVPEGADSSKPIAIGWLNYVPTADDDASQINPVLRLRHRLVQGCNGQIVMVPRDLAARPDAVLPQGHHELEIAGRTVEAVLGPAYLGHFPVRSPGQYLAKIAISHLQYTAMPDRHPDWGYHYREPFELLKRDPGAFLASTAAAAREYLLISVATADVRTVVAPFPYRGGPLRLTPSLKDETRGWRTLVEYAERLAFHFAVLSQGLTAADRETVGAHAAHVASLRAEVDRQVRLRKACEEEKEKVIQEQHATLLRQADSLREYDQALRDKEDCLQGLHREVLRQREKRLFQFFG